MIKPIAAAGAVAASLLAYSPAQAGVDVDIGFGLGFGPVYAYDDDDRITCNEGRRVVRRAGFRHVRAIDCRGRTFAYVGKRHGDRFVVRVSSRSGRIVDVD